MDPKRASMIDEPGKTSPQEEGETGTETLAKPSLNWKVVLFNDEEHTYDYVVEMLTSACKLSRENAFRCAVEVDMTGKTIVFYGTRPDCETVCSKILSFGPDHRLPQSMSSMSAETQSL
jgi:ATP-dependent Clp protease adaptor protein ClpS